MSDESNLGAAAVPGPGAPAISPTDGAASESPAPASAPPEPFPTEEWLALESALRSLDRVFGPEVAARAVLEAAVAATGATVGSVWLLTHDGMPYRAAGLGLTREYLEAQRHFPAWDPLQQDLVARSELEFYGGAGQPNLPIEQVELHEMLGVHQMVVLPLQARGHRFGSALLGHPDPNGFGAHTPAFLRVLCRVLSDVLDRSGPPTEPGGAHAIAARVAGAPERRSRELLAQMLYNLDSGVALLGGDDPSLIEHNPAFASLVAGDPSASLTGLRLAELVRGERGERLMKLVADALRDDRPHRAVELEGLTPNGVASSWSVTVAPVADEGPRGQVRVVVALTDITERRALEERVRHTHKMEAVGTLAGGIAHEFNNLLTAILGNVSLSLLDLPPTHPLVPGLRDSEAAALRAAELTRQLLGFGRRSPVSLRATELVGVVEEALARLSASVDARIRIERELPVAPVPVLADPGQLAQVIGNLCANACDAMPAGGVLSVSLRLEMPPRGATARQGEFACLEIRDTGEGMEPEVMARIYEPFFTTKGPDRGTGLGLAVVHVIVEQHGGWIECASAAGEGTSFRVYLPHRRAQAAPAPSAPGHGETVLVVDDEEALRGLARSVLERLGYRVLLARDGVEAVELVHGGAAVDLVLLDQTMPRMSGPETLLRLRAIAPELPVVLTSGYELEADLRGASALAVEGLLPKPYSPESLGNAVREALDSGR